MHVLYMRFTLKSDKNLHVMFWYDC